MPRNTLYYEIRYFLINGSTHDYLASKHKWALRLKCAQYQLIDGVIFRGNYDNFLLICLEKSDAKKVIIELHDGWAGGHFGGETTLDKILLASYYCQTLFRDSYAYARKCKTF